MTNLMGTLRSVFPRQGRASRPRLGEQGLVSLMITMVMMMVISLTVLGFAQMSRREQSQALDRQLSAQAFLAAETGVNDAKRAIAAAMQTSQTIPEKTQCARTTGSDPYAGFDPVLDPVNNVAYSCLLVTTRLQTVIQTIAADGSSAVVPLKPNGNQINRVHLTLSLSDDPSPLDLTRCPTSIPSATVGAFPRGTDWACPYGVIRLDMVPTDNLSRTQLMSSNRVAFLYPVRAAGTSTLAYAGMNGIVSPMACTTTGCSIDITNVSTAATNYALRIVGIYKGGTLTISSDDTSGNPILLQGVQAKIDVTGRAAGVLRRVETRVALGSSGSAPFSALESGSSICKRFGVGPGQFRIPSDIVGQDINNPLCKALTVVPAPPPVAPPPVITDPKCAAGNDIVMVLDTSKSMYAQWETTTRREKLMEVARDFVVNVNIGTFNHMAIIGFDDKAKMYTEMTGDEDVLLRAVDDLRNNQNTKYIPALTMARDDGWRLGAVRPSSPKVLVFISDGKNDDADSTILSLANNMKSSGVTIYTIAINMASSDIDILQKMASTGKFASASSESQLESIMDAIGDGVRCQP